MYIKEMLVEERPRERLIKYGSESLSNKELIAILLRNGTKKESVMELSDEVLKLIDNISDLNELTINRLIQIPGIKESKAITILAAVELGKRINQSSNNYLDKISSPKDVFDKYSSQFINVTHEELWAIFLNTKKQLINSKLIFKGSLDQSIVHPREIFNNAIKYSSSSIIIIHNHPSGDCTPSKDDIETTNNLIACSRIINIPIIDHIIIGKTNYYSFRENNLI